MNKVSTRRQFLTKLSRGGSTLALAPLLAQAASLHPTQTRASGLRGMLPVAAVEDCFDLAFTLPELSTLTKTALAGDIDLKIPGNKGRLAPRLVLKKDALFGVLQKIKNSSAEERSASADKLSFLLGILCNNALYEQLNSLYQQYVADIRELVIYQDVHLLRTLAKTEADSVKHADLNQLLQVLLPRTITRVHTLIPDSENGADWVVNMGRWRKENRARMEQYARVYTQPDPAKQKRYVQDTHLYRADDAVIRHCRATQRGEPLRPTTVDSSLATDVNQSRYAQAIATGTRHIRAVDQFLRNTMNASQLASELNV